MKLPKYRLQPLLDQKERAVKDKQEALVEVQKALEWEKYRLGQAQEELVRVKERRVTLKSNLEDQKMEGGNLAGLVEGYRNYFTRLDKQEQDAEANVFALERMVRVAEGRVEDARYELMEAAKEQKVMEKHKEQWIEKIKKEMAAKEAAEQEEIGTVMYLQHQREAKRRQEG